MNGPVLVTGGTGFIGAHVVRRLVAAGVPVRIFARTPDLLDRALRGTVEIARGDLREPAALRRAVAGTGAVVHLAACARAVSRDPHEFHDVNVAATGVLLDAACAAGVERFVHVSTILALPPFAPAALSGPATALTPYEATKMEAERRVAGAAARGLHAVIVRPTRVFGPGPLNDANSVTRIVALYLDGRFRTRLADGGVLANYVHADDVAQGILLALEHGARGAAYVLGGDNVAFAQLLDLIGEVAGTRRRVVAGPPPVARARGPAPPRWGPHGGAPPLPPGWLRTFLEDRRADITPAREALGYRPRSLRDGLTETVDWLRGRHLRSAA